MILALQLYDTTGETLRTAAIIFMALAGGTFYAVYMILKKEMKARGLFVLLLLLSLSWLFLQRAWIANSQYGAVQYALRQLGTISTAVERFAVLHENQYPPNIEIVQLFPLEKVPRNPEGYSYSYSVSADFKNYTLFLSHNDFFATTKTPPDYPQFSSRYGLREGGEK